MLSNLIQFHAILQKKGIQQHSITLYKKFINLYKNIILFCKKNIEIYLILSNIKYDIKIYQTLLNDFIKFIKIMKS